MSIFDDIKLKEFKQFFSRNVELLFIHVFGAGHFLKGSLIKPHLHEQFSFDKFTCQFLLLT